MCGAVSEGNRIGDKQSQKVKLRLQTKNQVGSKYMHRNVTNPKLVTQQSCVSD